MSLEKIPKDPPRFVYTSSLFESKPETASSQNLINETNPNSSQDASQGKIFGNSARFYKALKDYQQFSDPNILKEELWASRKEITNLEKLLLEKTEEILELKKSGNDVGKNDITRKALEAEKNSRKIFEMENIRLKNKIEELVSQNSDNSVLTKFKSYFELSVRKLVFESDDRFGRILSKLKESEFRIRKLGNMVNKVKESDRDNLENEIKEKMNEVLELKKEMGRLNRVIEKKTQENDERNKIYSGKIDELRGKNENLTSKLNSFTTETKLLNEINQELEKENLNIIKINEQQRNKIKELKKKLLKSINFVKKIRSNKIKSSSYDKLKEKYKDLKKKLKITKTSGKSSNNENHLQEVSKLEELNKMKDMKIIELQSEIQKRDMSINELLKNLEKEKLNSKGISFEKYEKVLNDFNKLNEEYEKLLRSYSECQENNEKYLNLESKYNELNENLIEIEASNLIYSEKIKKYKALLEMNNISFQHSREPSSGNFSNSEG